MSKFNKCATVEYKKMILDNERKARTNKMYNRVLFITTTVLALSACKMFLF